MVCVSSYCGILLWRDIHASYNGLLGNNECHRTICRSTGRRMRFRRQNAKNFIRNICNRACN